VLTHCVEEPFQLAVRAEWIRVRALEKAQQLRPRAPRPLARVHQEVPDRKQRGHVEEVVDVGAALLVLAAAVEVGEQVLGAERGRLDRQQRQVVADRSRFDLAIPALEILPPGLALEHGRARFQPRPDVGMAR
jgi:hypothetical protein